MADILNQTFDRLTVVEKLAPRGHNRFWKCICACGAYVDVPTVSLISKRTRSCGCYNRETASARHKTHGQSIVRTKEFIAWLNMVGRCENPNRAEYPNYGGRGIGISPELRQFADFYATLGDCPAGCSLDRIDVNDGYKPENVRWATITQQSRNKRNSRNLCLDGVVRTLAEWSEVTGLSVSCIHKRLSHWWSVERALTQPLRGKC